MSSAHLTYITPPFRFFIEVLGASKLHPTSKLASHLKVGISILPIDMAYATSWLRSIDAFQTFWLLI